MVSHLGILEPDHAGDITGTVVMLLDSNEDESIGDAFSNGNKGLKITASGVILSPQPADNPNDPLNWPMWRRNLAMIVISCYSFIIGGMTPVLAPIMSTLTIEFDKPLGTLTYLVGTFMLAMGVGSLLLAPVAVVYGKRLVYLVSQLIFFGACLWGANAKSFGSLLGARIIQGIGGGPAESLPSSTIAEIFFAHERAYRVGIYTLLMLGGKNLVPLVSGFVANSCGWHWVFWILSFISGGFCLATFLFVHETWWDRTPIPNKESLEESARAREARRRLHRPSWEELRPGVEGAIDADTVAASLKNENESIAADEETVLERKPFWQNLAIYSGRKSSDKLWMVFLRPFVLYTYPAILFSSLLYGSNVVWLSVIAETISTIFRAEPYHFPQTSVGLLYIGTFVGGCIGSAIAGKLSDFVVKKLSRMNKGVYEPEYRLIMVFPVMISVAIGLMGFGWATFNRDLWIVPAVFLGMLGFGTSLGSTVAITYSVDCYKIFAAEALVTINFFKNALGFCFAIFVPIFFHRSGGKTSFIVYGCLEIAICLLAIPLYRYGKILRRYRDKHDWVRRLYV